MIITWPVIMLLLAAICFLFAALGVNPPRISLVALGLLFWVIYVIVEHGR